MANNSAIYNAVIAGAGGASQERWITDTGTAAYDDFKVIIEEIATAVDADIAPTTIGASKQALMQAICQGVFAGRYPTSDNYTSIAQAIVALYDSLVASLFPDSGTSSFSRIYQQIWLDITKDPGGNGSIGAPYNAWVDAIAPLQASASPDPWVINLAQGLNVTGFPIPNLGVGGHATAMVVLQGAVQHGYYDYNNDTLNGLSFAAQDNGRIAIALNNLVVTSVTLTGTVTLEGLNAYLSTITEAAPVTGDSNLVDCSVNFITLPTWSLRMTGGTIDQANSIDSGFLDDVSLLTNLDLRWASTLTLTNCRFEAGAILRCSANQQLNVDLTTWGSMVAAGVTFPDTFPTIVITPWVPVLGQVSVPGTTNIPANSVVSFNAGQITPQAAEKNKGCIATFGNIQDSRIVVVGASINASRELVALVANTSAADRNLVNPIFEVSYLPRVSP